jgi:coenzyme PQQ biosynthesis protein PqqD
MIDRSTRPLRAPEILMQEVSGETVLLKPSSGEYYSLEEVAGEVWKRCDGTATVAELIAAVSSEYDAPAEEVEADVLEFLSEMFDEQLVTAAP